MFWAFSCVPGGTFCAIFWIILDAFYDDYL